MIIQFSTKTIALTYVRGCGEGGDGVVLGVVGGGDFIKYWFDYWYSQRYYKGGQH